MNTTVKRLWILALVISAIGGTGCRSVKIADISSFRSAPRTTPAPLASRPSSREWVRPLVEPMPFNPEFRSPPSSSTSTDVRSREIDPILTLVPLDATDAGGGVDAQTYTVERGDTLSGIARKMYGSAASWRKIYDANKDVLAAPNALRPGMELTIP